MTRRQPRMTGPVRTPFAIRLDELARAEPRHPAVVAPGASIGYGELAERVRTCARHLARHGIRAPVPTGLSVDDDLANLVACLAMLWTGIPQVPMPASEPLPQRLDVARRLAMTHVVADDDGQALDGVALVRVDRNDEGPDRADDPPPAAGDETADDPYAIYVTSSGTTGRPKLFGYGQRALARRAEAIVLAQGYAPDERVMVAMPVSTYTGKFARLVALWHGATAVLSAGGSAPISSLFDLCERQRVTTLQLTVLQARNLMTAAGDGRRLPAFTRVFLGAARMPPEFPRRFEEIVGAPVYDRYGTTEASLVATTWPQGDRGIDDAVGVPAPGMEVAIVDASGAPVPRGTVGEIRIRSDMMATSYVDDAQATRRHFRDAWFCPGDMGSMTEDGVLRYLGRKDDMMVLNGINIFPSEIERVLEEHPAIAAAAAFPIPSPLYGDIPAVAVELHPAAEADERSLAAYARQRLGARAPRRVIVVDELPRNAAGKVLKHELAAGLAGKRGDS